MKNTENFFPVFSSTHLITNKSWCCANFCIIRHLHSGNVVTSLTVIAPQITIPEVCFRFDYCAAIIRIRTAAKRAVANTPAC